MNGNAGPSNAERDPSVRLVEIVRSLASELNRPIPRRLTLDSSLSRDVGLDSLGRVELLLRVEREFGGVFPDSLLARAETPRDILVAIDAGGVAPLLSKKELLVPETPEGNPVHAETLPEVLAWHRQAHPQRVHVRMWESGESLTYEALANLGSRVAGSLQERGVSPGETVALMLPTSISYLTSFVGVLLAGAIPVPIYPPFRLADARAHLQRQSLILQNAQTNFLITSPEIKPLVHLMREKAKVLHDVVTAEDLNKGPPVHSLSVAPKATALLQYTSGSTGHPKGVVLTHANLLANLRAMGAAVNVTARDIFVSWLPLYHDMGLIGAWLGSLYFGMPLVLMSPTQFLVKPARWFHAIAKYHGTISAAPNFAYELCLHKIADDELKGVDLGSWRLALNGAEPVSPATIEAFAKRFDAFGFQRQAMTPVYGLAESCVGLAFPPLQRGPRLDIVDRITFQQSARAEPIAHPDTRALRFVACGHPLQGHEIRIVDPSGHELPDRSVGRVEFRGPSATRGYYHNVPETRKLFDGAWLDTGDLGYWAEGDLFLSGRVKDLIIRAGRHFFPEELEEAIGAIPGVRRGCVAVFSAPDVAGGTEKLVVMAEVRSEAGAFDSIRQAVIERSLGLSGSPPDDIVLVPPHTVPKTSSGKIRRSASREIYECGLYLRPRKASSVRLAAWRMRARVVQVARRARESAYALYAWLLFVAFALPVYIFVAVVPRPTWRRQIVHRTAKAFLGVAGIRVLTNEMPGMVGDGPKVWVANHASYVDGLVLEAVLPFDVTYVAKREFLLHRTTRVFLQRLGAMFVTRGDPIRGSREVSQFVEHVRDGKPILFFPEGGFGREPMLQPFHMGAFQVAAQSASAVVPIAIRGTRAILRSGSKFPRRNTVEVVFGTPILPEGAGWDAAVKLRDHAFEHIRKHCGEA